MPISPHRRLCLVGCSALLAALACGCPLFCRDRMVNVLVTDAETGKPLPDVVVRLDDSASPFEPSAGSARTGKDGVASLRVSPSDEYGATLTADGPDRLS